MRVSVIIPCFNVEKYISECLESVRNQSYPDLEIICVDDGSVDQTLSILEDFRKSISLPFKIISQKNLVLRSVAEPIISF